MTLTLTAVKKGEGPKEVMDAIKKDLPKAIVGDLDFLPAKLYGENWSVNLEDNLDGAQPDTYHVTLKEANQRYEAVYDKSGNILSSKSVIDKAKLPNELAATVSNKYPGWKIIKSREKITAKAGVVKGAYHVEIKKDKMYRSLFLDTSGKMIRDVRWHRL
jgi:hypothetical protein